MLARRPGSIVLGSLLGVAGAALVTLLLELASDSANVLSLAVCYQLLVLVVSGAFGAAAGLVTSAVSVAAFNFFFIPPVHTFTIAESRNWLSFAVFAATALITAHLAAGFRRQGDEAEARRQDAELVAGVAQSALADIGSEAHLETVARAAADALGVEHCQIVLAAGEGSGRATSLRPSPAGFAIPLVTRSRMLGLLEVGPARSDRPDARWRRAGFAATVGTVVSLAVERSQLVERAMEAEALRRSDALKTALLRTVSHEFRTPLTALRTAGGALAEDPGPADAESLLSVIRIETERLERLVANILDLSRLEAGAVDARIDWCDPTELAVGAVDAAEPLMDGAPVEVDVDPAAPLVRADAGLCERILVNLLHNAARHGVAPIRLDVRTSGDRLEFRVSDGGPGPDPLVRDRIFSPFASGPRSGGTGVGLALARGLAAAQGATVRHERVADRTVFVLALPLAAVPEVVDG